MHAKRTTLYSETLGARVSPEQMEMVAEAAAKAHVTPSVWVRSLIEKALCGDVGERVVLAEVVATRNILFTVIRAALMGDLPTVDLFDEWVKAADLKKYAAADGRIYESRGR